MKHKAIINYTIRLILLILLSFSYGSNTVAACLTDCPGYDEAVLCANNLDYSCSIENYNDYHTPAQIDCWVNNGHDNCSLDSDEYCTIVGAWNQHECFQDCDMVSGEYQWNQYIGTNCQACLDNNDCVEHFGFEDDYPEELLGSWMFKSWGEYDGSTTDCSNDPSEYSEVDATFTVENAMILNNDGTGYELWNLDDSQYNAFTWYDIDNTIYYTWTISTAAHAWEMIDGKLYTYEYSFDGDGNIASCDQMIIFERIVLGCQDMDACNYNPAATIDDGSCLTGGNECSNGTWGCDECGECGGNGPAQHYDCDGNCLEYDECGVCGGTGLAEVAGDVLAWHPAHVGGGYGDNFFGISDDIYSANQSAFDDREPITIHQKSTGLENQFDINHVTNVQGSYEGIDIRYLYINGDMSNAFGASITLEDSWYLTNQMLCDCTGNVDDCAGVCGGSATSDDCDDCISGIFDCAGECDGSAVEDCAGVCEGSATDAVCTTCASGIFDCTGECDGSAVRDCTGVCEGTAVKDCAGICEGDTPVDECGICEGGGLGSIPSTFTADYYHNPGDGSSPPFGTYLGSTEEYIIDNGGCTPFGQCDDFQVRWTGYIHAETSGTYNFYSQTDDGARLYIDDQLIIDAWHDSGNNQQIAEIDLNSGFHKLVYEYYENSGGAFASLQWAPSEFDGWEDMVAVVEKCDCNGDIELGCGCGLPGPDCAGECGGSAYNQGCGCGVYDELPTDGCDDVCGSISVYDVCGVCNGNGVPEGHCDCFGHVKDCEGVCGGSTFNDCAGVCGGSAEIDCLGVCGGSAIEDACGLCNGNGFPEGACNCAGDTEIDCAGVCDGKSVIDQCGECGGPGLATVFGDVLAWHPHHVENGYPYDFFGISASIHSANQSAFVEWEPVTIRQKSTGSEFKFHISYVTGVNGENEEGTEIRYLFLKRDCPLYLCPGNIIDVLGEDALLEDSWYLNNQMSCDCAGNDEDCAGVCGGSTTQEVCAECASGIFDCTGSCDGAAVQDECGVCNGNGIPAGACNCDGDTERDCAGICGGSAVQDCAGICGGSAIQDCAGVCGGSAVQDCAGGCNGPAVDLGCGCDLAAPDECSVCGGDGIGEGYCTCSGEVIDCLGVCGGWAIVDCNGDCNGWAEIDDCEICSGGYTGLLPNANLDCSGVCDGSDNPSDGFDCAGECLKYDEFDCDGNCLFELDCIGNCPSLYYEKCANEGEYCSFKSVVSDSVTIWYGPSSQETHQMEECNDDDAMGYAETVVSVKSIENAGSLGIDCENYVFGDPCGGQNKGCYIKKLHSAVIDCAGVCEGFANKDCAGVCGGFANKDCAGVCGGSTSQEVCDACESVIDECGVCGGPGLATVFGDVLAWHSHHVENGYDGEFFGISDDIYSANQSAFYEEPITIRQKSTGLEFQFQIKDVVNLQYDENGQGIWYLYIHTDCPEEFCPGSIFEVLRADVTLEDSWYLNNQMLCDCSGNVEDCAGVCGGSAVIDCAGVCDGSAVLDDNDECLAVNELIIPDDYSISSIYPNPFNPSTIISFSIPKFSLTTITVYDVTGRELKTLTNEVLSAGFYNVTWNASSYSSGLYLIRMESGDFMQIEQIMLIK